jgi:iron complex transport system substrate-binding protein
MAAATVLCASCAAQAASENITIIDSAGREVEIPYPVDKVVLLTADNCELAVVLDALDKVVGVEKSAPGYAEIGEMFGKAANAGGSQEPDFEKIADLNPDVVLGYKSSLENGVADELEGMGIPFVVCECNRIQTFEKDVELMGRILGKEDNAKEFLAFHNSIMDLIAERTSSISSDQRTSLYLTGGGTTFGKDGGIEPYLSAVGAKSIGSELPGESSVTVDPEWVLDQDPQVIVHWITSSKVKRRRRTPLQAGGASKAPPHESGIRLTRSQSEACLHRLASFEFQQIHLLVCIFFFLCPLLFNIISYYVSCNAITHCSDISAITPKFSAP